MKLWGLVTLLFALAATGSVVAAQTDADSPDYSVSCTAAKTSFAAGESVTLRFTVTNVKSEPIQFPAAYPAFVVVHLAVRDSSGSIVPPDSTPVQYYRNVLRTKTIAPGASLVVADIADESETRMVHDIPLWLFGYHLRSGRYTIVASPGLVAGGGEIHDDSLRSKPVVVEVQ